MKQRTFFRAVSLILAAVLLCGTMTGCGAVNGGNLKDTTRDENNKASLKAPIPLSGFEDVTGENKSCTYKMVAEITDTYTFTCDTATGITVKAPSGTQKGEQSVQAEIEEGDTVQITVKTEEAGEKFLLNAQADNHLVRLPYKPHFTVNPDELDTTGKAGQPTEISYTKRKGGTYVYLNNPEKLQPEDVGQAILRDEGLSGDVQVTWEHSNYTGKSIFLGYQLKNEGNTDVFVTVTNVGYQVEGEWLGQQSWSDYYNMKFDLPSDYFLPNGMTSERYRGQDFLDYTPRVFQPTTYRIPAGEYIYVVGGTSKDAYNETNVAGTANKLVGSRCTNAVCKMFITGGEVTGTFYCYNNPKQVQDEPEEQGYITMRNGTDFGWQYKGVDYHQALIENNPVFVVNDQTANGTLPVTYDVSYDKMANFRVKKPYGAFESQTETYEGASWHTNINPQNAHRGVGTDMSTFECVTTDGETVVIDNDHADGGKRPANTGNWMIDYHDNMTFVNEGDKARTFTINKSASGALMAMVLDREGKVLATKCTIVPIDGSSTKEQWEIYKVEVPAHSTVQLTVSFLLMGNSSGSVGHWVEVE